MLTHETIWLAIDRLAQSSGYSTSGLAKKAGLDPTSFNRSKRIGVDGKPRWPSTESISRILNATGSTITEFIALIGSEAVAQKSQSRIPFLSFSQAERDEFFTTEGHPTGEGWDYIDYPHPPENGTVIYALEISGNSMMPFFREGDRLIIAPHAPIRRGDRVVLKTTTGKIMASELNRQTASKIELKSLGNEKELSFTPREISWIARIVWVSQ